MIRLLANQTQTSICRSFSPSILKACPKEAKRLGHANTSDLKWFSSNAQDFPDSAEIVVAGAGAIGASVAYHLGKLGKSNVLVLEQGSLGCGTSWHSVGLVARIRNNALQSNMAKYSTELYSSLEMETGFDTGFKKTGSVIVARTKDRATLLKRTADKARQYGARCELISPKEAQDLYPIMKIDDIQMALWSPEEGATNASDVCQSLMKGATQNGVRFIEGVGVKSIATNGKRVVGVDTDRGFVHCEKFINCGGQWARELGLRSDPQVNIPLHSCEHYYIVTKPMDGVHNMLPTLRDQDGYFYVREWSGGLMAGGFEPVAKPCFYENGIPDKFEFQLLPEDWEQFEIIMENMIHRIPSLAQAEIRQFVNGPESFTPDGKFLFGETSEIENYFVAAAMSSSGIMSAAGMGKLTAELVTFGSCSWDTSLIDIKRLPKEQHNKLFLRDRVKEVLGCNYSIAYPKSSHASARMLKCSPLYDVLDKSGARWGEHSGWEVANYYAENGEDFPLTFGKPGWLSCVEREYQACNEDIALADLSWQSKFELTSNSAEQSLHMLQSICAANLDLAVGQSVKTALLTEDGKYKGVASVYRISQEKWLLTTGPAQHNHILPWLKRRFEADRSMTIEDVSSKYSIIGILGPSSEKVLGELTRSSLKIEDFGVRACKKIDLGYASEVILCRGYLNSENNWQAFVSNELARGLFQLIRHGDKERNVKVVGQFALDNLRLEAGIPEYGADMGPFTSPAVMGKFSFADVNKASPFVGKEALKQLSNENKMSFMKLSIDDVSNDNWAWGGEPVYVDDVIAGNLTSVSFCFNKMRLIAFGVFHKDQLTKSDSIVVEIAGIRHPASVVAIY